LDGSAFLSGSKGADSNAANTLNLSANEIVAIHGTYENYYYIRTFVDKNGMVERDASNKQRWMFVPKSAVDVSRAEERAHDRALQKKVLAYRDTMWDVWGRNNSNLSTAPWYNYTATQRQQALEVFAEAVFAKMNLSISGIGFDAVDGGGYDPDTREITISNFSLTNFFSYELTDTIIHEARHAYQHEAVLNPSKHIVSQQTRQQWGNNLASFPANYHEYPIISAPNYAKLLELYYTQPIEWDAYSFEGYELDPLGYKPVYPSSWD